MFTYLYPRIDANVSKGINHLLKSPFCIHPKTGKVCTPFDPAQVDLFDVNNVPTLNQVIAEISDGSKSIQCLEPCMKVFKKFLDTIRVEQGKSARKDGQQSMEF